LLLDQLQHQHQQASAETQQLEGLRAENERLRAELKAQDERLRAELKAQDERLRAVMEHVQGLEAWHAAARVALATQPRLAGTGETPDVR